VSKDFQTFSQDYVLSQSHNKDCIKIKILVNGVVTGYLNFFLVMSSSQLNDIKILQIDIKNTDGKIYSHAHISETTIRRDPF